MEVIWTIPARDDLDAITDYLDERELDAALRVGGAIFEAANNLRNFPKRGRPGRVQGTRELVLSKLPYVVIYQVEADVVILRVLHVAQEYPRREE